MTPKELVKAYGLAQCVSQAADLTASQLRGLAKIADDYGKTVYQSAFLAQLQSRRSAERKPRKIMPGSMLEALQAVGGVSAPYAWYSRTSSGQLVLHTWRNPEPGRMDGWHQADGVWTLDSRLSPPDAAWKSLPQYTALLNALDAQAAEHGDVVLAAISTDLTGGTGPAKRAPGSNALLVNADGTPARFTVEFDPRARWHCVRLAPGQDCDVGAA